MKATTTTKQTLGEGEIRFVAAKRFQCKGEEADKDQSAALSKLKGEFEAERSVLAWLQHPHIIRMYEAFEEKKQFNDRFRNLDLDKDDDNSNTSNDRFSLTTIPSFGTNVLASSVGIDNTCIRLKLSQPNVDALDLAYFFESFKLHPEQPITIVQNGKRIDPNALPTTGGRKWASVLYIIRFESALEAERALFEKCFTVISGVKTGFLWYDV